MIKPNQPKSQTTTWEVKNGILLGRKNVIFPKIKYKKRNVNKKNLAYKEAGPYLKIKKIE